MVRRTYPAGGHLDICPVMLDATVGAPCRRDLFELNRACKVLLRL